MDAEVGVLQQVEGAAERLALDAQRVGIGVEAADDFALRQPAVGIGAVLEDFIDEQRRKLAAVVHLAGGLVVFFVFKFNGNHVFVHSYTPFN